MASSSKNAFLEKCEKECDSETDAILSKKCDMSPAKEKPLSPILGSGIINRKFFGRRLRHKNNRVKLSNKFAEYERNEVDSDKSLGATGVANQIHPLLVDDNFTPNSDECLLNRINRLERLENNKHLIYRILITDSKSDIFFKKPMSPAPVRIKKHGAAQFTNLNKKESVEHLQWSGGRKSNVCIFENYDKMGKLCENNITQLGDTSNVDHLGNILLPGFKNTSRAYANPSKGANNDEECSALLSSENTERFLDDDLNMDIKNKMQFNKKLDANQCSSLTQEICDSGVSNTQMLYALDDMLSSLGYNKDNKDIEIEGKANVDFKGFEKDEILRSGDTLQQLISLYKNFEVLSTNSNNKIRENKQRIFPITNPTHDRREIINSSAKGKDTKYETKNWAIRNKRKVELIGQNIFEGFSSAPMKRIKLSSNNLCVESSINMVSKIEKSPLIEESIGKQTNISNMPEKSYPLNGFCSASGKSINISKQLLKEAGNIFEDLYLNLKADNENICNDLHFNYSPPNTSKSTKSNNSNLLLDDTTNIKMETNILKAFDKDNSLKGFCNASGKLINISEESLKKAGNIFNEDINVDSSNQCVSKAVVEQFRSNKNEIPTNNGAEMFSDITKLCSASGKLINVSEDSLKKAGKIINEDINADSSKENVQSCVSKGVIKSSINAVSKIKKSSLTEETIRKQTNIMIMPDKSDSFNGFCSASGKSINISEQLLKKAANIFDDLNLNSSEDNLSAVNENICSNLHFNYYPSNTSKDAKSNNSNLLLDDKTNIKMETNIPEAFDMNNSFKGFCNASGKLINISEDSLKKAREIFNEDINVDSSKKNLQSCISKGVVEQFRSNINEKPTNNGAGIFSDITTHNGKSEGDAEDENITKISHIKNKYAKIEAHDIRPSNYSSNHLISISKNTFEVNVADAIQSHINQCNTTKAYISTPVHFQAAETEYIKTDKCALQEGDISNNNDQANETIGSPRKSNILNNGLLEKLNSKSNKKRLGVTHCKQIQIAGSKLSKAKLIFDEDFSSISPVVPQPIINTYNSTPIRKDSSCSTPIRNDSVAPRKSFTSFMDSINITPIKVNIDIDNKTDPSIRFNARILLFPPAKESHAESISELEREKTKLEERLSLILKRQKVLESRKEEKLHINKRPKTGVLYQSKCNNNRISLVSFVNNHYPGDDSHNTESFSINPHNAENVHFNEQLSAVVTTKDVAIIVPNTKNIIGVCEIENAFNAMPGVDPNLLLKGWIRNHYKWIVWKLASYENMFPTKFKECLNVENVIQQLKYRYDREIDKAERSALRKIYEKDDVPQKRMVLCVSNIKTVGLKNFEIELSDGWYAIRTIIDDPLCNQVSRGKIKVGTKLITTGAQLLNCDGCHPLEATDLTCLKINFNCTRRAIWHAKLGYQKSAGPFPISLQSVDPLGGLIGCLKICIMRMYPFRYLEKINNHSVWLNQKANEVRGQKWENDRRKKIEKIQENLGNHINTYDKGHTSLEMHYPTDLSGISCGKILYETIQNSNDPEFVQQNLTSSQREAVLDYHHNLSMRKQQEMSALLSEDVNRLKLNKRDVTPVLKLLIMDVNSTSNRAFNFFIWRPTETHAQVLKEGTIVTVENVIPKMNGDLNTTAKTMFKPQATNNDFINTFKRRLVQIVEFSDKTFSPNFNEFDSVGIVVQTKIDAYVQEVWIADSTGRLLLINVNEGSSTCLLLENLKRCETITICNLAFCAVKKGIVHALANHFTVFSSYSQHKHLQEGLLMLRNKLPEDMDKLLTTCDSRIEVYRTEYLDINNTISEDSDEDTLVSSRITTTDIALSLIDLNKFT